MDCVDSVDSVDSVDCVDCVDSVDSVDCVDCVDCVDGAEICSDKPGVDVQCGLLWRQVKTTLTKLSHDI